jgi:hypothetical protein
MENKHCPHCNQLMNVYKRSIRKGLVDALTQLNQVGFSKSSDLNIPIGINGDFSKMRFWGLIYKPTDDRNIWGITVKGKRFLEGEIRIPKYVYIYNNSVEKYSEETISVEDVKEEKVDKESVLNEATPKEEFNPEDVE